MAEVDFEINAQPGAKIIDYFNGLKIYTVYSIEYITPSRVMYHLADDLGKKLIIRAEDFTSPRFEVASLKYIEQLRINKEISLFKQAEERIMECRNLLPVDKSTIQHVFNEAYESRNQKLKRLLIEE